ncbi:MAG: hypothetical protein L0216_14785 [Planctomycetales bacterium]|nr:hypothetical protein [Planctomycetales bacterium]
MDRGVPLFILGVALVLADISLFLFSPDPAALARKGVGLLAPVGVVLAVLSGPVGRPAGRKGSA